MINEETPITLAEYKRLLGLGQTFRFDATDSPIVEFEISLKVRGRLTPETREAILEGMYKYDRDKFTRSING